MCDGFRKVYSAPLSMSLAQMTQILVEDRPSVSMSIANSMSVPFFPDLPYSFFVEA
jgi:hypothetical protein